MRPSKSSGRTNLAIWAKSNGERMSAFGNFMPPFGHSVIAFARASSSVGAQERCNWSTLGITLGSFPASRAPASNRSNSPAIFSTGAPTVMRPSALRPARLAVIGPAVATRISGGTSGMVHRRVDSSR